MIGINIMTAVSNYEETCRIAVEAGADVIISGAGLPLKLPEYVEDSNTLFAPIVSSGKAAALLCRNYSKKYGRLPDFFVMEGQLRMCTFKDVRMGLQKNFWSKRVAEL